jgi:YNFM family putative membrane transporter
MREIILLLALGSASSGISLRIVEPMLPRLASDFGTTVPAAAAVITAFAAGYAIGQLLYGPLGDRFGKLRVATLSQLGAAVLTMACALAPDAGTLAALRFITALLASASTILGMAYIGDTVPVAERQPVVARFIIGTISGQAMGPLVGGVFTDLFGWKGAFLAAGGLFALVPAILYLRTASQWATEKRSMASGNPYAAYLQIVKLSRVRYVLFVAFTDAFLFFGAYSFLGALLKERFDLSFTAIGAILAGFGVGGILYTFAVRALLVSLGQGGMAALGGLICCASFALITLSPFVELALPCTVALGLSFYMLHNTVQLKATEMAPQARGASVSSYASLWSVGQAAGVAVMGAAITQFQYTVPIIAFGIGFALLGVWMRARLARF